MNVRDLLVKLRYHSRQAHSKENFKKNKIYTQKLGYTKGQKMKIFKKSCVLKCYYCLNIQTLCFAICLVSFCSLFGNKIWTQRLPTSLHYIKRQKTWSKAVTWLCIPNKKSES